MIVSIGVHDAIRAGTEVTVFVGPYEHHSNLLPWRESGATLIEIDEAKTGGVDLVDLESKLKAHAGGGMLIGAFSAASNVTGVCTDPGPVSRLVKSYGGRILWDYAGGAPYLPMSMNPDGIEIDAIVFSPHKFIGGPGASGILVMRRDAAQTKVPNRPGGGTVVFVNAQQHDYVANLEQREEGGTPNVIGDIRAALAILVKEAIGQDHIDKINLTMSEVGISKFEALNTALLLAPDRQTRLPIFSFAPMDNKGNRVDYKTFTTALSQQEGIQARGGCSCAGPYVHTLLGIDDATSANLRSDLLNGDDKNKPGFVRFNLSYLMDEATVEAIFAGISKVCDNSSN